MQGPLLLVVPFADAGVEFCVGCDDIAACDNGLAAQQHPTTPSKTLQFIEILLAWQRNP
jgi:hypothetical protein